MMVMMITGMMILMIDTPVLNNKMMLITSMMIMMIDTPVLNMTLILSCDYHAIIIMFI